MAVTVTYTGNVITLIPDGASNWDISSIFPQGVRLGGIKFYPSAVGDILVIRHGSASGPIITKMKDITGSGTKDMFPQGLDCKPFFHQGSCTFTSATNVIIILELL